MSPPTGKSLTIPSRLDALGPVRADARALAIEQGFEIQDAEDFALCVHEAVSNAIVHGHRESPERPVALRIEIERHALRATVANGGPGFDYETVMRALGDAGEQPRGRGMGIIRSLTDELEWSDGGRVLTFLKRPRGE